MPDVPQLSTLNPSTLDRIRALLAPDWAHRIAARRSAAAGLAVLALVAALRPDPGLAPAPVLIATRDLPPGVPLAAGDVRVQSRPTATVPDGALSDPAGVLNATPAVGIRRGEILTDLRVLGSRLTETGDDPTLRVAPIRLADPAVVDVLRVGDLVDVLAAGEDSENAQLLASDALVVLIPPPRNGPADGRILLVALPATAAQRVAAVALTEAITVTLR
ncbi:SAF domain-containing protein [Mycolicibacterium brumae]|uniref:Flagellar biosynthesis protein FlgA n=1 Tax=Mycolicibacterium brumae TaxID=85968 RepID=A0A2G5PEY1_9MYCO|nr:SAF domain-containing protein [Mycolicibacterium brumae]MCV7191907.1 flagellar biosynthesis protein FlgA [Mycolicibacterium brumae]PIB76878.1 flagellar biosynthesis protein FlgA [Mycolicibacterium brumae]RWA20579.1 hypothetical protein MBRU_02665 [Mycolicibacterium brumae DSM 44177]UWW07675.1 SAF domain-containing protein [Mycolicibacterium brumae]